MRSSPPGRRTSLCRNAQELLNIAGRYAIPLEQQCQLFCFARELCVLLQRTPASRFTRRAARLIRKYHARGVAGNLLQEVGEQVIAWWCLPQERRNG